jgi:hypothetical protein
VFQSVDITAASIHDIQMLKDVKMTYLKCTLHGDMGYLSAEIQLNLFEIVQIKFQTPMRKNQLDYIEKTYVFKKVRERIYTLFSKMCDQFKIRENFATTFNYFKIRIISKITAITLIKYSNKFVYNRPINNLKVNRA